LRTAGDGAIKAEKRFCRAVRREGIRDGPGVAPCHPGLQANRRRRVKTATIHVTRRQSSCTYLTTSANRRTNGRHWMTCQRRWHSQHARCNCYSRYCF